MRNEPGGFQSLWAFDTVDHDAFTAAAVQALEIIAGFDGFVEGHVLHNVDDHGRYVVATRWVDVGSMRRSMSSARAKLEVWPFLAGMRDEPSVFETLASATPAGTDRFPSSATGA